MPAPAGSKRVKGVSIHRPFVYGSAAHPIPPPPATRPPHIPPEHTHQWTVYVRGVDGSDLTHWLKKVQFKLHETYANPLRLIESPPFEVTETGWGEFEVQIKLYFVGESGEKPQTVWHPLKLHPFGPTGSGEGGAGKEGEVVSQNYEEVVFNEPVEGFFDILTGGLPPPGSAGAIAQAAGKGKKKGGPHQQQGGASGQQGILRTAEVPRKRSPGNPYSEETEGGELDRMKIAIRKVEEMVGKEREKLKEREEVLAELKKSEGVATGGGVGRKK